MYTILVLGSGGREHALASCLKNCPSVSRVLLAPGSTALSSFFEVHDISLSNVNALLELAKKEKVDLTIVGPEQPLSQGIADCFQAEGLKIFAPTAKAAQIESSKDFAKNLMEKYNIPTAKSKTFEDKLACLEYCKNKNFPIVLKEDGLRAGKGVTLCYSEEMLKATIDVLFEKPNKVLVEDYLQGEEFSYIALVHNSQIIPLDLAQDHKALLDDNKGPNTGGMGAISPVPSIPESARQEAFEKVLKPTAQALVAEGVPFTGFLYAGLMLCQDGVKTIEFNARLGDPETEVLLPRLESDLAQVLIDLLEGKTTHLKWSKTFAHGIVFTAQGYPKEYEKDVYLGDETLSEKVEKGTLFFMGVKKEKGSYLSTGGRVLLSLSLANTPEEAFEKNYLSLEQAWTKSMHYRKDIGKITQFLKQKKTQED